MHAGQYLQRLHREIELESALFERRRNVRQSHFGGGTPANLIPGQVAALFKELGRHFNINRSEQREFSIEIDPRTLEAITLTELAQPSCRSARSP